MKQCQTEFRIGEKEIANYFSNAAALYVLGVGFGYFAYRSQTPFMMAACFWFSVFMLCDSFRLARVCRRLDGNGNLLLKVDAEGLTHFTSWLQPERRSWKEISSFRHVKTPMGDTVYFQCAARPTNIFRQALFGSVKIYLPLASVQNGYEGFLDTLSSFPSAAHLLPETAARPQELGKAA